MSAPNPKQITTRRKTIVARIKEAFSVVINDMFLFTEASGEELAAEYLLTVRIAEKIAATNLNSGVPLKVHLEQATRTFATNCFPIGRHHNGKLIPRQQRQTKRSGHIDIAVHREENGITIPVCAIEVKRLNPSNHLTNEDLERNAEYFTYTDELQQRSAIEFAAFATLHKYKTVSERRKQWDINKARELYARRANKIKLPKNVKHYVSIHEIDQNLVNPNMPQTIGEEIIDAGTYLYLGVIIIFHWSEHTDDEPTPQADTAHNPLTY